MSVQQTTFTCGSTAIAIQITHCLADAQSLATFANDWATTSRALLAGLPTPELSPVFDPQLLDSFAAGDIDSSSPDPKIQKQARGLPQHRYDWYKAVPNQPWPTNNLVDFPHAAILSPSDPIPWEQWETKAPVSHRVLHFSKSEAEHLYRLASTEAGVKISKHDALLAHIWSQITIAWDLKVGTTSWLDMTFGLRARVQKPLPESFLGGPVTHAAITCRVASSLPSLPDLAREIRATLAEFTPEKISMLLHDKAFEVAPQRLWHACLGREHILLTTGDHSGVYDVVFEEGKKGKYVEAVMPYMDGLVEVMEAPGAKGGSWIENGVDVSVYLEEKAMERLEVDGKLWAAE